MFAHAAFSCLCMYHIPFPWAAAFDFQITSCTVLRGEAVEDGKVMQPCPRLGLRHRQETIQGLTCIMLVLDLKLTQATPTHHFYILVLDLKLTQATPTHHFYILLPHVAV